MVVSQNGVEPIPPAAVEGSGLPAEAAQQNAPFLSDVGLLVEDAPGTYKPTPVAMQFINTMATSQDRGRKVLRSLVAKSWFARAVTDAVQAWGIVPRPELIAELSAIAETRDGNPDRSMGVLLDYLTYTGIVTETERGFARADTGVLERAPAGPTTSAARAVSSRSLTDSKPSAPTSKSDLPNWEVLQTSEFELRILATPGAVGRLRKHLDLLEEKLKSEGPTHRTP